MPSTLPSRLSAGRPFHPVPQPLFEIEATEQRDSFVIQVRGELDLSERPRLDRALAKSEASDAQRIVLDLDELTFIDAAGLHCLVAAHGRSTAKGSRLRMTRGNGNVATILHLTTLDQTLPFTQAR